MTEVNHLACVAAAATFLLGGLWYGPLFGRLWCRHAYGDAETAKAKGGHPGKVFGSAFVLSLVTAYTLAIVLGPRPELGRAVLTCAGIGAGCVAPAFGINYAFANRGVTLWLVDGGYHTVHFATIGLVLGLWH